MGDDFHALLGGGKTGWQKVRFSFLLYNAKTAGAKGNKPSIVTEGGDFDPGRLSALENRLALLNAYIDSVDIQFNGLVSHSLLKLE
jgi:hypothetical protein